MVLEKAKSVASAIFFHCVCYSFLALFRAWVTEEKNLYIVLSIVLNVN